MFSLVKTFPVISKIYLNASIRIGDLKFGGIYTCISKMSFSILFWVLPDSEKSLGYIHMLNCRSLMDLMNLITKFKEINSEILFVQLCTFTSSYSY